MIEAPILLGSVEGHKLLILLEERQQRSWFEGHWFLRHSGPRCSNPADYKLAMQTVDGWLLTYIYIAEDFAGITSSN